MQQPDPAPLADEFAPTRRSPLNLPPWLPAARKKPRRPGARGLHAVPPCFTGSAGDLSGAPPAAAAPAPIMGSSQRRLLGAPVGPPFPARLRSELPRASPEGSFQSTASPPCRRRRGYSSPSSPLPWLIVAEKYSDAGRGRATGEPSPHGAYASTPDAISCTMCTWFPSGSATQAP